MPADRALAIFYCGRRGAVPMSGPWVYGRRARCRRPLSPLPEWADDQARHDGELAQDRAVCLMAQFDAVAPILRRVDTVVGNLPLALHLVRVRGVVTPEAAEPIVRAMLAENTAGRR